MRRFAISLRILVLEIDLFKLKSETLFITDGKVNEEILLENAIADNDSLIVNTQFNKKGLLKSIEFLVTRGQKRKLAVRIDASKKHNAPHLHIDINGNLHNASISIDNGVLLAGKLEKKVLKKIQIWINTNKKSLLKIWEQVQLGNTPNNHKKQIKPLEL